MTYKKYDKSRNINQNETNTFLKKVSHMELCWKGHKQMACAERLLWHSITQCQTAFSNARHNSLRFLFQILISFVLKAVTDVAVTKKTHEFRVQFRPWGRRWQSWLETSLRLATTNLSTSCDHYIRQKNNLHFCISVKYKPILITFGIQHPMKIWQQKVSKLPASSVHCGGSTTWKSMEKVAFQQCSTAALSKQLVRQSFQ